eukprot:GHVS01065589.1.p1 GENE.GHVS01065589.1~~GHVS01065589.1.p1  ORF type:complete len:366 (+),score=88.52 GHVS01065589.1:230-1327(+)
MMEVPSAAVAAYLFFLLSLSHLLPVTAAPSSSSDHDEPQRSLPEVSSNLGAFSPLPLPVSGECTADDSFHIDSLAKLYENADKLDCIFAAGIPPANVPLGFGYGYILTIANTGAYDKLVQLLYQGDFVVKTQCRGKFYNIGWLSIAGMDVGTSVWTIDQLGWEMADGELPEGDKKSVLMDFTVNFEELCAPEGNESPLGLLGFSPFQSSIFPLSAFKDIGRVVGVDTDGGVIMLNKALIHSKGHGAQTVLFYAVKSFDSAVVPPGFGSATVMVVPKGPNGETVMKYKRRALDGLILRALGALFDPAQLSVAFAQREVAHHQDLVDRLGESSREIASVNAADEALEGVVEEAENSGPAVVEEEKKA